MFVHGRQMNTVSLLALIKLHTSATKHTIHIVIPVIWKSPHTPVYPARILIISTNLESAKVQKS